jgi:hypothetical protein
MRRLVSLLSACTLLPALAGALSRLLGLRSSAWGVAAGASTAQGCVLARTLLAAGFVYHVALLFVSCAEWSLGGAGFVSGAGAGSRWALAGRWARRARGALLAVHLGLHAFGRSLLSAGLSCGGSSAGCGSRSGSGGGACCGERAVVLRAGYFAALAWVSLGLLERLPASGRVRWLSGLAGWVCAGLSVAAAVAPLPSWASSASGAVGEELLVADALGQGLLGAGVWVLFWSGGGGGLELRVGGA